MLQELIIAMFGGQADSEPRLKEQVTSAYVNALKLYGPILGSPPATGTDCSVYCHYCPEILDGLPEVIRQQFGQGKTIESIMVPNWNDGPDVPTQVNVGSSLVNLAAAAFLGARQMGLTPKQAAEQARIAKKHESDHAGPLLACGVPLEFGTIFMPGINPKSGKIELDQIAYTLPAERVAEVSMLLMLQSAVAVSPASKQDLNFIDFLVAAIPPGCLPPTGENLRLGVLNEP